MRPAYFVPETKLVGELFVEMQEQRQQMAIIVDEYGGTAGIVTLELLLEEMVGRLVDELGQPVEEFKAIDERTVRVDGGHERRRGARGARAADPRGRLRDGRRLRARRRSATSRRKARRVTGDGLLASRVAEVKGRKIEEVVVTRLPAERSRPRTTSREQPAAQAP